MTKDYYKILEIDDKSSFEEIRNSYRKLAKEYHPDRNPDDVLAEDKFKLISEAYSILSDPDKKKKYDSTRVNNIAGNWGGYDINDIMEDLKGTGFAENFDRHFGAGFGYAAKRGSDVNVELSITLDDVYNGCTKYFNFIVNGPNTVSANYTETRNTLNESVNIEIPRGVNSGHIIRVKDMGNYNPYNSQLPRGDLLVNIFVINDVRLKREGDDAICSVDVPLYTAILGGDIYITNISNKNKLKIKVPELSKQGQVLRLKHRGFPKYSPSFIWESGKSTADEVPERYGDMLVNINIIMPTSLTEEERSVFEQLKKINEANGKS